MYVKAVLSVNVNSRKALITPLKSNEWFFVVLKQMGMGNAGRRKPGLFLVILFSYSYTGKRNLFSYNFFKIPELLYCPVKILYSQVVICKQRALYNIKNRNSRKQYFTLMEGRGDFMDTVVRRAVAAGWMPIAKTLGTALRVSSIQVIVTWSTPAVAFQKSGQYYRLFLIPCRQWLIFSAFSPPSPIHSQRW